MNEHFNHFHNQVARLLSNPDYDKCLSELDQKLGFRLNVKDTQAFKYFHTYISTSNHSFIKEWQEDERNRKWYNNLTNGILGDVQNSLACVIYHYENLCKLETDALETLEKVNYRELLGGVTTSTGNSLKLDFEYQAFILALRRCLDYLTRAICAYFKNDFHSFRKLPEQIKKVDQNNNFLRLTEITRKYIEVFKSVISDGERKSVRDRISHYEYVSAGCINLSRRGFVIAGGGEDMWISGSQYELLSDVLTKRVTDLKLCLNEHIFTFTDIISCEQQSLEMNKKTST